MLPEHQETVPSRVGLQNLPAELLLQIIGLFANPARCREDFVPLYSLSLTNRRLYHLTIPFLFRVVDNRWYNERRFPEMILRNPRLASEIKYLACLNRPAKPPRIVSVLSRRGWQALSEKAEELGLRNARRFCHLGQAYSLTDFVAVLLLLTPNLECLDVSDDIEFGDTYWGNDSDAAMWMPILEDAGCDQSSLGIRHFQHLHTIRIARGSSRLEPKAESILSLFKLRSLRTLILEKRYLTPAELIQDHEEDSIESSVENLYLLDCQIDSSTVAYMLSLIKALRVFVHEWARIMWPSRIADLGTDARMDHSTLTTALLAQKDSLEYLSIHSGSETRGDEMHATLCDLGEMHKLHFLEVGLENFAAKMKPPASDTTLLNQGIGIAELLPRCLRKLHISIKHLGRNDGFWTTYLAAVTAHCKVKAPALTEVKLFLVHRKPEDETVRPKTFPLVGSIKGATMSIEYLFNSRHQLDKGRRYLSKEVEFRTLMYDFVPPS